eukprot:scaffold1395_cov397-Prasinococcus_capsulatus_cf.AAC.6
MPVIQAPARDERYMHAPATSSGLPSRPKGGASRRPSGSRSWAHTFKPCAWDGIRLCIYSSGTSRLECTWDILVGKYPGATTFIVTGACASFLANRVARWWVR